MVMVMVMQMWKPLTLPFTDFRSPLPNPPHPRGWGTRPTHRPTAPRLSGKDGAGCPAVLLARRFGGKNIGGQVADDGFRASRWADSRYQKYSCQTTFLPFPPRLLSAVPSWKTWRVGKKIIRHPAGVTSARSRTRCGAWRSHRSVRPAVCPEADALDPHGPA